MERYGLEGSREYKAAMDLTGADTPFWDGSVSNLLRVRFRPVTSALLTCYKFASNLLERNG